mmetsp:Transcript_34425/g.103070  ORF Transcript_34425/g.103070 Transcript_34425/m.103070 type:complete len:208 (-) Transcript_34425:382-1005(-)
MVCRPSRSNSHSACMQTLTTTMPSEPSYALVATTGRPTAITNSGTACPSLVCAILTAARVTAPSCMSTTSTSTSYRMISGASSSRCHSTRPHPCLRPRHSHPWLPVGPLLPLIHFLEQQAGQATGGLMSHIAACMVRCSADTGSLEEGPTSRKRSTSAACAKAVTRRMRAFGSSSPFSQLTPGTARRHAFGWMTSWSAQPLLAHMPP